MVNILLKKILEIEDVAAIQPNFALLAKLTKEQASQAQTLIFDAVKNTLRLLTTNENPPAVDTITQNLQKKGYKTELYYTDVVSFQTALAWYDQMAQHQAETAEATAHTQNAQGSSAEEMIQKLYDEKQNYDDGKFLGEMIRLTYQSGASDLHFQQEEGAVLMRMRKDGLLKELLRFTPIEFKKYLLKLKFMAGAKMNIDYLPQDGRFDFDVDINGNQKKIDVRVSFMPGLRGEGVVMRYLDAEGSIKTFTDIGFTEDHIELMKKHLNSNFGMILVTGPTGSGKTTTLYSMLNYLNDSRKKIITLEDPVEYEIPGVEQSQINALKGYTFEEGLKSILRHDPDIILVGEIRTKETAEIALNAALTGHLVLSTLHTNSAVEAISRLLNLGVEPYMLAPALNMIVGQRLLRQLHTCATKQDATMAQNEEIKAAVRTISQIDPRHTPTYDGHIFAPVGCDECNNDGYAWRLAVAEILDVTTNIKDMILTGKSTLDIYAEVRSHGYLTMKDDAYTKMLEGKTTLDEIRRVL